MTQTEIEAICREENQSFLYYNVLDVIGTQQKVARLMANTSDRFKSVNSWAMFLSRTMWSISTDKPTKPRLTMQQEFNRIAKELLQ